METARLKDELRARIRAARKAIPRADRLADEKALAQRLVAFPAMKRARVVGVYHAAESEASLAPTVRALRLFDPAPAVCYPLVISKDAMVFSRFEEGDELGILDDPKRVHGEMDVTRVVSPSAVDVMLVPGVAFDAHGNRLGQGGGYYDRYLPHLRGDAVTIGIAFDEQVVDEVPRGPHDRKVDYVATPNRLIAVG